MRTTDVKMYKEYLYKGKTIVTIGGIIRGTLKAGGMPESFYHPLTYAEKWFYVSDGTQGFKVRARNLSIIPMVLV